MKRVVLALIAFPVALAAQRQDDFPIDLSLRATGGMLNPDDPFEVTGSFGAAAGVRANKVALLLTVLHQLDSPGTSADLAENARTFVGVLVEYSGNPPDRYRRAPLVELGAGRLKRSSFETTWYVNAGIGLRYPVSRHAAFLGRFDDYFTTLTDEPVRCPPGAICTQTEKKLDQHNFGFLVTLELLL